MYREAKTWPADRVDRYWNEVLEHDMLEQEAAMRTSALHFRHHACAFRLRRDCGQRTTSIT